MNKTAGSKRPASSCLSASLVVSLPILVIAILVLGEIFLTALGGILIIADPLRASDAVVVLSGGQDMSRLEEGAKIFLDKNAKWLVLTEITSPEGEKVSETTQLFKETARSLGVPDSATLVTNQASFSTKAEAEQTLALMNQKGFTSAIIVTDPFHTFRTRLIFRSVFRNTGIDLYVRPVRNHWYRSTTWWTSDEGRKATISEYVKIAAYIFGEQTDLVE